MNIDENVVESIVKRVVSQLNTPLLPWLDRLEGLVLYRWNRRYPADAWLDVRPGPPGWTLARREEFSGHSHERITKEVYTR